MTIFNIRQQLALLLMKEEKINFEKKETKIWLKSGTRESIVMEKRLRKKKKSFLKKENTILPKIVLGRAVLWKREIEEEKETIKEDKQRQKMIPGISKYSKNDFKKIKN